MTHPVYLRVRESSIQIVYKRLERFVAVFILIYTYICYRGCFVAIKRVCVYVYRDKNINFLILFRSACYEGPRAGQKISCTS